MRLGGEVQATQVVPRAGSPSLEVTIATAPAAPSPCSPAASRLGGVDAGAALVIEGVGRHRAGRVLVLNPAYTLLA